jgi:hypothetical protein
MVIPSCLITADPLRRSDVARHRRAKACTGNKRLAFAIQGNKVAHDRFLKFCQTEFDRYMQVVCPDKRLAMSKLPVMAGAHRLELM